MCTFTCIYMSAYENEAMEEYISRKWGRGGDFIY